jgi:hypothetical protein
VSGDQVACPSAGCEVGAQLLGVVLPSGRLAYAAGELIVDAEFVAAAREGGAPERRFRFSSPCVRGACRQWTGSSCGVIERLRSLSDVPQPGGALPPCAIRPKCRWYLQEGAAACAICPEVVTDNRGSEE